MTDEEIDKNSTKKFLGHVWSVIKGRRKIFLANKVKGVLSVFFMSLFFYMMITTKYTRALGDYILEYAGLKSWTGNNSGTHLTVIYFGILFIISLIFVKRYAVVN